jgi:hypothetical protein
MTVSREVSHSPSKTPKNPMVLPVVGWVANCATPINSHDTEIKQYQIDDDSFLFLVRHLMRATKPDAESPDEKVQTFDTREQGKEFALACRKSSMFARLPRNVLYPKLTLPSSLWQVLCQ